MSRLTISWHSLCALALFACGSAEGVSDAAREARRGDATGRPATASAASTVAPTAPTAPIAPVASPAALFERRLRFDAVSHATIDGDLAEWKHFVAGATQDPDASERFAATLGTDADSLYVAARISDLHGPRGDASVTVRIRFLDGGTSSAPWRVTVRVHDGRASVTTRPPGENAPESSVADAAAALGGDADSLSIEARVPWSALAPAARSRVGLRAAVVYARDDRERSVVGMGDVQEGICPMPFEQTLLESLEPLAAELWPHPQRSWLDAGADFPFAIDLTGDGRLDRVGKLGGQVSVCTAALPGEAPHCEIRDLGPRARVESVEGARVTRDDREDLVIRYWQPVELAQHQVLEIVPVERAKPLAPVFRHEITVMQCCGSEANPPPRLRDSVKLELHAITLKAEKPWRLDAKRFVEAPLGGDILPIVAPWDEPKERRYVFRNGAFLPSP